MAAIRNSTIFQNLQRIFAFKTNDRIGDQVGGIIVPVVIIGNNVNVVRGSDRQTSGALTVFTTPTDRDFYLTHCHLSQVKDATHDGATGTLIIRTTIAGVLRVLLSLPILVTTAQDNSQSVHFDPPVLIDRGAAILTAGSGSTFTAGTQSTTADVVGYTTDTNAKRPV